MTRPLVLDARDSASAGRTMQVTVFVIQDMIEQQG
jgi:hypothetical protein